MQRNQALDEQLSVVEGESGHGGKSERCRRLYDEKGGGAVAELATRYWRKKERRVALALGWPSNLVAQQDRPTEPAERRFESLKLL